MKFASTTISLSLVGSFPFTSSIAFIFLGSEDIFTTYSLLSDDNNISVEYDPSTYFTFFIFFSDSISSSINPIVDNIFRSYTFCLS